METVSLKALANKVLQGNRKGNPVETEIKKVETFARENGNPGKPIEVNKFLTYIADIDNLSKDVQEFFEERAAIIEYDGGLSKEEAEQKASELTSIFFQKPINRITKFYD